MDPNPLDFPEIVSVDANPIDSGRPFGLCQGHQEFLRPQYFSFAGYQVDQDEDRGADRGINGEFGRKMTMGLPSFFSQRYQSAHNCSRNRAHKEIGNGRIVPHLYLKWKIA